MSNATANALSELRKQIEANKKLLTEQENALAVLERMMGQSNFSQQSVPVQSALVDLSVLDHEGKPTLRSQVEDAIERLGARDFSVSTIDDALRHQGITINGKYPRSRISMVLAILEKRGYITKTVEGGGNVPHRYKAIPSEARGLV